MPTCCCTQVKNSISTAGVLTYPEIDLVYWAGGNPFHHHQDLNRLRQAWSRPATVIVNEPFWTATMPMFNGRGACLAGVQITDALRPGVIELATGAWYDPLDPQAAQSLDVHGNPNVLTRDAGTSKLGQGSTAHGCLVQVERFDGLLPPVKAFTQPATVKIEQQ